MTRWRNFLGLLFHLPKKSGPDGNSSSPAARAEAPRPQPKTRNSKPATSSRRGLALLLALLVIALASAGVLFSIRMAHLEATVSENMYAFTQAEIYARAGLEGAMTLLAMDDNKYDDLSESWAQFERWAPLATAILDDGRLTGRIEDLSGRFNVNYLMGAKGLVEPNRVAQFIRLLDLMGLDREIVPAVLDWLDPDDEVRPGGAEDAFYQSRPKPYHCGNAPFVSLGQLTMVKGVTSEMFEGTKDRPGLKDVLTVWSDGLININTASETVLMSLDDGLTQGLAQEIIRRRSEKAFEKLDDLKEIPGLTPVLLARVGGRLSVSGAYFLVRIEAGFREAEVRITAVVLRQGGGAKIVYYRSS